MTPSARVAGDQRYIQLKVSDRNTTVIKFGCRLNACQVTFTAVHVKMKFHKNTRGIQFLQQTLSILTSYCCSSTISIVRSALITYTAIRQSAGAHLVTSSTFSYPGTSKHLPYHNLDVSNLSITAPCCQPIAECHDNGPPTSVDHLTKNKSILSPRKNNEGLLT